MINDSKTEIAEFEHFESIVNPDDLILIQEFIKNPDLQINERKIINYFKKMNVEINVNELAKAMHDNYFLLKI